MPKSPRVSAFHHAPVAFVSALSICALVALTACGSSSGTSRPDGVECRECEACTACPAAPRPGPKPVLIDASLLSTDRSRHIALIALSADGKSALVRIEDELVGDYFQQLDLTSGLAPKAIKAWPFQQFTEPTTRKQALKAVKPEASWPPSQRSSTGLVALAADEADSVAIYLMKDERAVKVAQIARLKGDSGVASDVSVTKLAWDPTSSHLIVIHAQTLPTSPPFTSDWIHVLTIDPATLPF